MTSSYFKAVAMTAIDKNASQSHAAPLQKRIVSFLREHSEIETILAVALGLLVTRRFQLRGVKAVLINLLIINLIGQLLELLKQPDSGTSQRVREEKERTALQTVGSFGQYTILHAVPGRIRLRVPQLAQDRVFAQRLEELLADDENVVDVRINRDAASVAIKYQTREISDIELGWRLMNILNRAESEEQSVETAAH
ncbi:HMA2 domain-containing protein [Pleurocapsa sp. PCC 7327]|uniref:HMA2 domain-containing protein n=1 Tax=Pleurocapsa sp. PCC 7327 TaxID=118163 RepID=UPI0006883AF3|nr:hypothetical protein [Pleurocapsa sp. PCC 7327]